MYIWNLCSQDSIKQILLFEHSYSLYPGEITEACVFLYFLSIHSPPLMCRIPGPVYSSLLLAPFPSPDSALPTSFPWVRHPWSPLNPSLPVASSSFCGGRGQEEEELSRVLLNLRRKDLGRNTPNLPFHPARLNQLTERRTCPEAVQGKSRFKLVNALHCNLKVGKRNSGSSPSTCLHCE